jgi:hypothetical protein
MDYVFHLSAPVSVKDAAKHRVIRTQPSQIVYSKARVPGVAGNLPLPSEIKYELGHKTLLRQIFDKMDGYISQQQQLDPKAAEPNQIVETDEETKAA